MFAKTCNVYIFVFLVIFLPKTIFSQTPSVIIVGAGPAGISAASKLLQNGFTNITILEAEDRIGGRIQSVYFGDAFVDLGAEWCHGEEGNVVHSLVKDLNLLQADIDPEQCLYSKRTSINHVTDEILVILQDIYENQTGKKDGISTGDDLSLRYNETMYNLYSDQPEKLEIAHEVVDTLINQINAFDGTFSWFDSSSKNDYSICAGNNLLWSGHGYKTILDVLMQKFPNAEKELPVIEKTLLNKEVSKIIWNDCVTVETTDGSVFSADHAIITTSLGVLKQEHENWFSPPLPDVKRHVINTLGIGAVMKVILHFPTRWWPANFTSVAFVWSGEDKRSLEKEFLLGPRKEGDSWLTGISDFRLYNYNQNVITIWFSGRFVPELELESDDTLIDGIMFVLDKFLGHKCNITRPDSIKRSGWYNNPHFRGTYSYQTVASRTTNISPEIILSQPLIGRNGKPTVLFAGEATHSYYYSTVHGAIETGFREADRVLGMYN